MRSTVYIYEDKIQGMRGCLSPYDADFVQALKEAIPPRERSWYKTGKMWIISEEHWDTLDYLVSAYYDNVLYESDAWKSPTPDDWKKQKTSYQNPSAQYPTGTTVEHLMLCITSEAPPELIRAAYRILSKVNHPDVGGTTKKMSDINVAYGKLMQKGH